MKTYILNFNKVSINDISQVGGKNASLGEMISNLNQYGINIPEGFAITAQAYWDFLDSNNIRVKLTDALSKLDTNSYSNLHDVGKQCRELILQGSIHETLLGAIKSAYEELLNKNLKGLSLAVRSSATAEDLPNASFAGQHESYLNVYGEENLIKTCIRCYASLFTDRAIKYRNDNGFDHMKVALSIGVQKMIRSDLASAGVGFTIDPESGFENAILLTGAWGLGENVVQGAVNPDEFYLFKPSLKSNKKAIINKKLGSKLQTMIYAFENKEGVFITNSDTPKKKQEQYVLSDEEVTLLGKWSLKIEEHYGRPMDIEWAKDGETGDLYIVQARPETIHGNKVREIIAQKEYTLKEKGEILAKGKGIGNKITSGIARVLESPSDSHLLKTGEILVTDITNPDWDPILKKASAIITNRGGRTSHAAIVARELGAVAVVGTGNATDLIRTGDKVTVSCEDGINGLIYKGYLAYEEREVDYKHLPIPEITEAKFILADPDKAFKLSFLPNNGVGLLRLEFIINNSIRIHPMALAHFDSLKDAETKAEIEKLTHHFSNKKEYFTEKLSQSVGTIAAAFYPKEVIVRMSDFKSNEYANLVGGKEFEPYEENPMLGFRGASRYYSPEYKDGFALECEAMRIVREEMGFSNVKIMIPFCRTLEEGRKVIEVLGNHGLKKGKDGLEIYMMVEIPSNVILAREFAKIFSGFSIGSNDLTQLMLGIDRDSSLLTNLFNERNPAVLEMIRHAIHAAKEAGIKIGLCGQAPSDYPEFSQFLVEEGISSISFNPDALVQGLKNIVEAEKSLKATA